MSGQNNLILRIGKIDQPSLGGPAKNLASVR
jgi:hypothetical protein